MVSTIPSSWILQALTFRERRRIAEANPETVNDLSALEGTRHLLKYHHWFTRGGRDGKGWSRFLADSALSEINLVNILAPRSTVGLPAWTKTLTGLADYLRSRSSSFHKNRNTIDNIVIPVAAYAWCHFQEGGRVNLDALLSSEARLALQRSLRTRLARVLANAVEDTSEPTPLGGKIGGTNVRNTKRLPGISCESVALQLLQTYPALGRLWAVQVENWSRFIHEFIVSAEAFSRTQGFSRTGKCLIEAIGPDLSDLHHGGRTVMRVRFAAGNDWFYKPRSSKFEFQWFSLLEWLNRAGFYTPFRIIRVISHDDHSWMEGVLPRQCTSREEVARYYYRAGAILYLFQLLRGVDAHAGNVIAAGGDPVLVDCESLLHPVTRISKERTKAEEGSILRTGMLPIGKETPGAQDTSALGRNVLGKHSVRLKGKQMRVADFVDSVADGFCSMHEFILARAEPFDAIVNRFRSTRCRYIYRPTIQYVSLLKHSLSHEMLCDGLDRSLFLLALCRDGLVPTRTALSELAALECGDIPVTYGRTSRPHRPPSQRAMDAMLAEIRAVLNADN
jgi:hypothetical protein